MSVCDCLYLVSVLILIYLSLDERSGRDSFDKDVVVRIKNTKLECLPFQVVHVRGSSKCEV